ncbi:MAG TPA: hypothetical protein PLQ87_06925, partial [Phycisphaerae bacterium]|nr:hypothetical protein [Phycisphaerae bacterium]
MAGQPKIPFYIALGVVIIGLIGFALYRSDILVPQGAREGGAAPVAPVATPTGETASQQPAGTGPEAADAASVTTVKEYKFTPAERLPEVKGISAYKPLADETVRFALNVWAGWAPIIQANDGFKAGKVWKTPDGKSFKVELVLIDNPVAMRDAYAAGDVHIGWATLDMVPLFLEGFVDAGGKP